MSAAAFPSLVSVDWLSERCPSTLIAPLFVICMSLAQASVQEA